MTISTTGRLRKPLWSVLFAGGLLAAELLVIGTIFKHGIDFTCLDNWPRGACVAASKTLVSMYCVIAALFLLIMLRPIPFQKLASSAGGRPWALGLNAAGFAIALFPIVILNQASGVDGLWLTFMCWILGMSAILAGVALYVAPVSKWRELFVQNWGVLILVAGAGAVAPTFAAMIRPLWRIDGIAEVTFNIVTSITLSLGYEVQFDEAQKIIGSGDFFINIAPQCSGIEGIALVTLFVSIYLLLFRKDLRFPRALLLYPIGILTSAAFNILRITVLLLIGLEGNPELAVGGFHSHAGWLMFTIIAIGIVVLAQSVPALQRASEQNQAAVSHAPELLPWRQDLVVASILPFAIFMLSALLAQAFSQSPSLIYPGRVILMTLTLTLFWQVLIRLPWRLDPVALLSGLVIGIGWVAIPVEPSETAPYGALSGAALIGWFVMRGLGTTVLIPIIEELFFRGYLEKRLRLGTGALWPYAAAVLTAGLFAALHDRWVEAFIAGLIFSWVARRRENITDAIVSHAAANALVFGAAVATNNLAMI